MDTDRKIALFISGGVLAAFAGIAVMTSFTGKRVDDLASTQPAMVEPDVKTSRIEPAAYTPTAPSISRDSISAGTPAEADAFEVEPGVNYLARGLEAYRERNWDHAAAYFMAEVDENPQRPYSRYLLGLSLWKAGRLEAARDAMVSSAEQDPKAIKTFVNLSRIENDRGEFDAALVAARDALTLDPEDATALFLEGRSLHNVGDSSAAAASLGRSVDINPDNGYVWNLLGLVRLEAEQGQEALDALTTAADLEPEVAYIQNNLGMVLERSGHRSDAMAAYLRASEIDPGHHSASRNLARLESTLPVPGDETEAIALSASEVENTEGAVQ